MEKETTKKCEVCECDIHVKKEKFGSNKGGQKSSSSTYSDEGVYYEDGNCWFCNGCWAELFQGSKVDYRKFL